MSDDIIIDVKNVWKRYGLPPLLPWKRRALHENDCALKDISFQVRRGGSLGILGRNGAGKSTLLKLLAGVTPPDKGSIDIRGSIFPMIELNAGISMELSGRENIQLLATIMGFSDKAIRRLEPEVVDFSELEGWIDKPVWQYSSGMLARLAFGIAVHARADILLVDEVLSTGDIQFQKKCQKHVQKLLSNGTTLLFVSHSAYFVERVCNTGLLLDRGKLIINGDVHTVVDNYLQRSFRKAEKYIVKDLSLDMDTRQGSGEIRVLKCHINNAQGETTHQVSYMESVNIIIEYISYHNLKNIDLSINLYTNEGMLITCLSYLSNEKIKFNATKGKHTISCAVESFPVMGKGIYIDICFSKDTLYSIDYVQNALMLDSLPKNGFRSQTCRYQGLLECTATWK